MNLYLINFSYFLFNIFIVTVFRFYLMKLRYSSNKTILTLNMQTVKHLPSVPRRYRPLKIYTLKSSYLWNMTYHIRVLFFQMYLKAVKEMYNLYNLLIFIVKIWIFPYDCRMHVNVNTGNLPQQWWKHLGILVCET